VHHSDPVAPEGACAQVGPLTDAWQVLNGEIVQCRTCPRLVAWREQVASQRRRAYRDWEYWGRPVTGFGDTGARLLIVGLAPGAHGSNRTGRMFTGDSSGDTLYAALYRVGFANRPCATHRGDGLCLRDAFITAVARCAPPLNRPTPTEIAACRPFLEREWDLMPQVEVVLALGQVAFGHCLHLLADRGYAVPRPRFAHGVHYAIGSNGLGAPLHLVASYHPSRQNTQTGRLTPQMLDQVFDLSRSLVTA
jgi:uracil-DNA glycosylase family 4